MKTEEYSYRMPERLLPAIVNGDISGLSSEDIEEYNAVINEEYRILKEHIGSNGVWSFSDESYFCPCPDFSKYANNVYDAVYTVFIQ